MRKRKEKKVLGIVAEAQEGLYRYLRNTPMALCTTPNARHTPTRGTWGVVPQPHWTWTSESAMAFQGRRAAIFPACFSLPPDWWTCSFTEDRMVISELCPSLLIMVYVWGVGCTHAWCVCVCMYYMSVWCVHACGRVYVKAYVCAYACTCVWGRETPFCCRSFPQETGIPMFSDQPKLHLT